ncbi:lysophospholipid acyltransferase family protein [Mucilaginibacter paludis]|uniref:Phospholipid/glycerol acyltransferase n=1 Tax=Mucilaginibacter paludis DSM 18603 TaxID=714943 RepID=H1YFD9_9SPHI|nr:lysophospholipid acyltransferase family protein [Mucilaginibacter paludis]EHQ27247.1 phospholipid/glycerol acyltransferase [Mucilaginibacter paludis DSM 18603]
MNKFFGYLLTPGYYLFFWFWLGIFHPTQWLAYNIGGYKAHKAVVDLMNFFLVATCYLLGNRVTFTNVQTLPTNRPIIFLANHQSMYDIPPIIWFLRKHHAKFISKIELTKGIPSISYNLRHGGGANIDRKDTKQSIMEIVKLANRMTENNWSAVIFPEGTRAKDGKAKTFQVGGVATILKKCPQALLVPLAIDNSWRMVQYGFFPLSALEHITLKVLPPIEPGNTPVEQLVLKAEMDIKRALGQA